MRYQLVIRVNMDSPDDPAAAKLAAMVPVPNATGAPMEHGRVVSVSTKLQRVFADRAPVKVRR
jgi:hypothetical protein